ncbi:glycosyltransferase family 77 protein [Desulfomicrobium sp. ZS1]|uniref:putative nucleotide-diphospho-sugar transferase n=1 Tax=Desulfomicrobium sp. ZS1 TaxID=2952228 RepID=UPI0020B23007|nr:putative nucleotide-diphospho-sugar transferase [Desulfomicrobium sp. ZS1]UTF50110.1 glycosyltransferase family 77 protein [Desulfomicrobium sp. ZS1]
MFTIITCGDSKYFEFLQNFENNIFTIFGYYPTIYDLGLKEDEKAQLKSEVRKIPIKEKFWELNTIGYVKTTHKPRCIKDILNEKIQDCIYVDADVIFTSKIQETEIDNADIGITPRHTKERKPEYFTNGHINAGFIFFKNTEDVKLLIDKWILSCKDQDTTDQKALSDILKEEIDIINGEKIQKYKNINVLLLDPSIFNDVSCKTGRMFHFKNAGRREDSLKKYRNFVSLQANFPRIIGFITNLRRLWLKFTRRITGAERRFWEN